MGTEASEGSRAGATATPPQGLPPMASAAAGVGGGSGEALAKLVEAVEALAGTVLSAAVSDHELLASVGVIRRLQAMLAAERYRRVAEVDERCAFRSVGAGSTETWLAESQRVARPDAVVEVAVAQALLELRATAELLARGEIDEASARVAGMAWRDVARETTATPATGDADAADDPGDHGQDRHADEADDGRASDPASDAASGQHHGSEWAGDGYPAGADAGDPDRGGAGDHGDDDRGDSGGANAWDEDEIAARVAAQERAREQARRDFDEMVAGQAKEKDRQGVSRGVRRWREQQDPTRGLSRARRAHRRRDLWIANRRDADGTTRVSGRLDEIGVAKLRAAIDALSRPAEDADRRDEDKRTAGQRRADALVGLAERSLNAGDLPRVTRQRPHVLLVTSPDGLHGVDGAPAPHLDGVGDIASETARMLCCDASMAPVTIRNGEVLDASPRQATVSARQRDAVLARDRECVGCGTRAAMCQIHHIIWLSRGGTHDLDNLVLVCFDCHFHIHHHGWQVARHASGRYWLVRPTGLTEPASSETADGAHEPPNPASQAEQAEAAANAQTPCTHEGPSGEAYDPAARNGHGPEGSDWEPGGNPSPAGATAPRASGWQPAPQEAARASWASNSSSSTEPPPSPGGQAEPRGDPRGHGVRGSPSGPRGRGSPARSGERRTPDDLGEPDPAEPDPARLDFTEPRLFAE